MVLLSYIFITVWGCFWAGLMYMQPHRTKQEKVKQMLVWGIIALTVNQLINRGGIRLLPEELDPMVHAIQVMYLFTFSAMMTALILLVGYLFFRRQK